MKAWWQSIARPARFAFAAGALAILVSTAGFGWWLLHPDRAVLFADLRPQDAAMMAAELEKMKLGYTVADNGATLLVDRAQVHATRMKLMGRDLPLHGAVGFELFNNADFGMTEFAQKINYQRALQGELTRTILSFPEVRDARVHLALPEQGLFRQSTSHPKAAVTLSLRPGFGLRPEQVNGIQRLVAAAVPGLVAAEVTLVDEQGIALSRPAGDADGAGAPASVRLDFKRETEDYLSRKAGAVLERAFGPGQALASVDATLDMEQVRTTTEDVIPAPEARAGGATGVLVRERESARDNAAPEGRAPDARAVRGSSVQREVEYQAGRRVEQVVSQPGTIRRLQVVAVLRPVLDAQQQEQVRRMLAAAVGASFERGDTVVVQSFASTHSAAPAATGPAHADSSPTVSSDVPWPLLATTGLLVLLGSGAWLLRPRRSRALAPALLTEGERRAALRRVEAWLEDGAPAPSTASARGLP